MAVRTVITGEDPVLRTACSTISTFDESVERLLTDLQDTMRHHHGVGLSAPQIGESLRALVADIGEGVVALLNPTIVSASGSQTSVESCLSFPRVTLELTRPDIIHVQAQDRYGREIHLQARGLLARVLCHEIDHLDGVLFFDHLSDEEFYLQFFRQVAGSSPTKKGTAAAASAGHEQSQDMQLVFDMLADAVWKIELSLDLLRQHSDLMNMQTEHFTELANLANQLGHVSKRWESSFHHDH